MATEITRRIFSVDEYHRMGEAGILGEGERLELLDGEIISTSPIGDRKVACVNRLSRLLHEIARYAAIVSVHNPIRLGEYSEPVPDITMLNYRADFYAEAPPTPFNVLLVIEVSDTTLEFDKGVKIPLYAKAGIPEAWLVDVENGMIEVYTHPTGSVYSRIRIVQRGEGFEMTGVEGVMVEGERVLG